MAFHVSNYLEIDSGESSLRRVSVQRKAELELVCFSVARIERIALRAAFPSQEEPIRYFGRLATNVKRR